MATKIRIAARLRPKIQGEVNDEAVSVQNDDTGSFVMVNHPRDQTQRFKFPFSSCYGPNSIQEEIYKNDVKPLLDVVFDGVTVTVFAYGVTSSGKTHTIQGSKTQPGIIPRVVQDLFDRQASITDVQVNISASYMEIYKEEVYDLLVDRESAPKLPVRENEAGQVFVAYLSAIPLSSVSEFDRIYSAATKRRSVGSTNLNHASSRSHAILTLHVQMIDSANNQTITGKINLVDLAGSENNKLTGNDPSRMAESAAINKSLSVLGQVVHALNQGASRIPYRNSKLTRILQDALGGSAVGLLICNLAPGTKFRQDTWNTLNFATRTKEIENRPVVNVRDNQPAPKPHFAALAQQAPSLPSANVASSSRQSGRPSLLPTAGSSKLLGASKGRLSTFGLSNSSAYQSFSAATSGASAGARRPSAESTKSGGRGSNNSSGILGLTEEEIDERISKAVEIEVARRLEQLEKRRAEAEKKEAEQQVAKPPSSLSSTPDLIPPDMRSRSGLPSGVLTPLLKRHEDLDNELRRRLVELEEKYEQNHNRERSHEIQLADVLSPSSKKKTGRAYVALARAHSEKGDLAVALDLYRKAETYVPDNMKLKSRIIEIEYAVNNNVPFIPRHSKKTQGGTRNANASTLDVVESSVLDREQSDSDEESDTDSRKSRKQKATDRNPFEEATNQPDRGLNSGDSPKKVSKPKRHAGEPGVEFEQTGLPKKQIRRDVFDSGVRSSGEELDDDDEDDAEWVRNSLLI